MTPKYFAYLKEACTSKIPINPPKVIIIFEWHIKNTDR